MAEWNFDNTLLLAFSLRPYLHVSGLSEFPLNTEISKISKIRKYKP